MLKKRITSIFLSIFIVIGVVSSDYSTVMAVDIPTAFWGTLEYSRAFFTAMQTGGALDRGINFEDFSRSNQRQWQELAPKIMEAYQLFCFYKEKVVVSAEHPDWTMEQINSEAATRSFKLKDDFENNAIKVQNTTGTITLKDWGYWREFCKEFSDIAKNGLQGGSLDENTNIRPTLENRSSMTITESLQNNIGSNCFEYDGNYYIDKGSIYNATLQSVVNVSINNVPTDRVRIGFVAVYKNGTNKISETPWSVDINRLTMQVIGVYNSGFSITSSATTSDQIGTINTIIKNSNIPLLIMDSFDQSTITDYGNSYRTKLSVSIGSQALDWQYKAQEGLEGSEAGTSIKKGNEAQRTKTVVREGSVPIKRSSLKEEDQDGTKVISGIIGWDIPQSRVIEGTIANPAEEDEEIKQIGVIDVPAEDIIDRPEDNDIVIPGDTPIVIPEDVIIDQPIPAIPIIDIFKLQYGPFYPTSMDITEFFPFCIPFDIAYCINKFRVGEGEAPIITIPIVYPRVLQPTLGESYTVTIDFNDYIALRNIIRYFILLLFIIGLMTITRNLIRG